ncbi:MAG: SdiA-regulated domain-containing protein [Bacteroidales bacterium]|nr:SdiA-regulated domain-containing protein [Bacteroidales bacterium]MBN2756449.1 SdiA-regulated domain-containing protein [Bacteroidales bacterium]
MKRNISIFLILISFLLSCSHIENEKLNEPLNLLSSYSIDVPEPSGLSFSSGKAALYVVSDNTNKIYKITFTGKVLSTIDFSGYDLEGVCFDENSNAIWIVEERERKLIKIDLLGNILKSIKIDIEINDENKGLEGLTINNENGFLYIVNEYNPSILIKLDENQHIISNYTLNFASDYSGIYYDEYLEKLWILSDESSKLTLCSLEGKAEKTYNIGINKAEGIVVDSKNNKVYIVSDSNEKLYVFQF